jgi:hypothetical protein
MSRRWRAVSVALVAIGTLVVSGCTGIPTSGGVQRSDVVVEPPAADIEFLPASPVPGASPEAILRGFIDAASSPQNDYAVAREFLATTLNAEWDPNARVIVDSGAREYVVTSEGTMTLVTQSQAWVDSRGNYTERDVSERVSLTFSFIQENGEWRIVSAPEGVLLERYTFDQVFGQHALYFFDPTFTLLVPDLRYFPSRASTPTRIMKALLAGPSDWLASAGAVVTAFPPETQLVAETVPITGTSASVDITGSALDSTLEQKRRMLRQAAASLSSLSSIFTVQLSIAGVPQDVSAQSEDVAKGYPQVDARPLVIADTKFGYLTSSGVIEEIPRIGPAVSTMTPLAAAFSDVHNAAALNTDQGVMIVRSSGATGLIDGRSDLAPAVFDYYGYVWSVPRGKPNDLIATTISGVKRFVENPWPSDGRVVSISLSRDGTRIAALMETGGATKLLVSGISRDGQNGPTAVGEPLVVSVTPGTSTSAVWADSLTIAVLTTLGDGRSSLTLDTIGGGARLVSPSSPGVTLAAGNSVSELYMRSADNGLFGYRGSGTWPNVATNVQVQVQVQ